MPITRLLDEKTRKAIFSDNWPIRRRWMKWSLFFMAGNIEAIIVWTIVAGGNTFGVQIVMSLIAAAISLLMFYIFGAVWDDHSKRKFFGPPPCDDNSESEPDDADANPAKAD